MSIGIYKIVSPSGKIYIGQSSNIENRKYYKIGYIDINDGTSQSNFTLFTQTYAAFAEETAPFGQVKDITGFLYSTSTQQRISMRRVVDVQ